MFEEIPFSSVMARYRLSVADLANLAGVSKRTVYRWRRNNNPPQWVLKLCAATAGDIGTVSDSWRGWRIKDGKLWNPEGHPFTPADLYALLWLRA